MKLYIFSQSSTQTICANASFDAALKYLRAQEDSAEAIKELEILNEVAFAYECQSSKIGKYSIAQEVKAGKLRFNISKAVEKAPLRMVDVVTEAEAKALLDAEMGFKTIKNEGGKRWLITPAGNVVHVAQADENALPVLSTLCNAYGGMIGAVVA